ncbi:hypothetical protein EXIGLDRAFT_700725 [Exidia glandulosa HHB12029]|uniref:Uncharacterized protein n=1 Tax=Exidia glandulosa HHB12029 TaxID=1314781 RepID=A0A165DB64_EXIGL|nr:hypothetical protein EXIGLDRAFT_700725 [Exidia glandulosa HHB12029]
MSNVAHVKGPQHRNATTAHHSQGSISLTRTEADVTIKLVVSCNEFLAHARREYDNARDILCGARATQTAATPSVTGCGARSTTQTAYGREMCSHHPPSARVTVRESCIERARTNEDGAYGKAGVVEPRKRNECTDAEGSVIVRVLAFKLGTRLWITTHATLSRHCSSVDRFAPNTPAYLTSLVLGAFASSRAESSKPPPEENLRSPFFVGAVGEFHPSRTSACTAIRVGAARMGILPSSIYRFAPTTAPLAMPARSFKSVPYSTGIRRISIVTSRINVQKPPRDENECSPNLIGAVDDLSRLGPASAVSADLSFARSRSKFRVLNVYHVSYQESTSARPREVWSTHLVAFALHANAHPTGSNRNDGARFQVLTLSSSRCASSHSLGFRATADSWAGAIAVLDGDGKRLGSGVPMESTRPVYSGYTVRIERQGKTWLGRSTIPQHGLAPTTIAVTHRAHHDTQSASRPALPLRSNREMSKQPVRPLGKLVTGPNGHPVIGVGHPGSWPPKRLPQAMREYSAAQRVDPALVPESYDTTPFDGVHPEQEGMRYPQALPVERVACPELLVGVCDRMLFDSSKRSMYKDHVLRAATHPAFRPSVKADGTFPERIYVPGQRELTPGIPLRLVDSRRPHLSRTYAHLITLETFRLFENIDQSEFAYKVPSYATFFNKAQLLRDALLGSSRNILPGESEPIACAEKAFYELGWTPNIRDSGNHELGGEGSFSIAVTSGEGQGIGHVQPASQPFSAAIQQRRRLVNIRFGDMIRESIFVSLTREEFESEECVGNQNNALCFGSPNNVFLNGLQVNVSFITTDTNSLLASLGRHQGCNHVDPHDCLACYTVVFMLLRLPRGSDPGAFVYAAFGLFARRFSVLNQTETEVEWVAVLIFIGREVHGGEAPRVPPDTPKPVTQEERQRAVRFVLVGYASTVAVLRTGTMAAFPPDGFGSAMQSSVQKQAQLNVTQHGLDVLGTVGHVVNWLVQETEFSAHNQRATRYALGQTSTFVSYLRVNIERETYIDEYGEEQHCRFTAIDPVLEPERNALQLSNVSHVYGCARHFSLKVRKQEVMDARADARGVQLSQLPIFSVAGLQSCETNVVEAKEAYLVRLSGSANSWKWVANELWIDGSGRKEELIQCFKQEGSSGYSWDAALLAEEFEICRDCNCDLCGELCDEPEHQLGEELPAGPSDADARVTSLTPSPPLIPTPLPPAHEPSSPRRTPTPPPIPGPGPASNPGPTPAPGPTTGSKRKRSDEDTAKESGGPGKRIKGSRKVEVDSARIELAVDILTQTISVENLLEGRSLFSRTDQRYLNGPSLSTVLDRFSQLSSQATSLRQQSSPDRMKSLQVVTECARIHSLLYGVQHQSRMLDIMTRFTLCHSIVHLKDWLVSDSPALMHQIFEPVIHGESPRTTGLAWLDGLITQLYIYAQDSQTGRLPAVAESSGVPAKVVSTINVEVATEFAPPDDGPEATSAPPDDGPEPTSAPDSEESSDDDGSDWEPALKARRRNPAPSTFESTLTRAIPSAALAAKAGELRTVTYTIRRAKIRAGKKPLYTELINIGVDVLFGMLVFPSIRRTMRTVLPAMKGVQSTLVLRTKAFLVAAGTVLSLLSDIAGTPTIWVFRSIESLLWSQPHRLIPQYTNYLRMGMPLLLRSEVNAIEPLRVAFTAVFKSRPDVQELLSKLEDPLLYHSQEIERNRLIAQESMPPPFKSRGPSARSSHQRGSGKKHSAREILPEDIEFTPADSTYPFRFANFLLAATIALRTNGTTGIGELDLFLQGTHPTVAGRQLKFTSDQLNPVPALWDVISDLKPLLGLPLRADHGLSNLLAVFGSGQSKHTAKFLKKWMRDIPKSDEEMFDLWDTAAHVNETIIQDAALTAKRINEAFLSIWPDYTPLENMRVWGTASHMISFGSNGQRIWEWFDEDIQSKWSAFVARLSVEALPSWDDMLEFVLSLEVAPFKGDSLSTMHIVNRLAECELCCRPTTVEMALWISRHCDRGAYAGLHDLGFASLDTANHIVLAFSMFHNFLEQRLDAKVKQVIDFSTIFTENYLCKIIRVRRLVKLLKIEGLVETWMERFFAQPNVGVVCNWRRWWRGHCRCQFILSSSPQRSSDCKLPTMPADCTVERCKCKNCKPGKDGVCKACDHDVRGHISQADTTQRRTRQYGASTNKHDKAAPTTSKTKLALSDNEHDNSSTDESNSDDSSSESDRDRTRGAPSKGKKLKDLNNYFAGVAMGIRSFDAKATMSEAEEETEQGLKGKPRKAKKVQDPDDQPMRRKKGRPAKDNNVVPVGQVVFLNVGLEGADEYNAPGDFPMHRVDEPEQGRIESMERYELAYCAAAGEVFLIDPTWTTKQATCAMKKLFPRAMAWLEDNAKAKFGRGHDIEKDPVWRVLMRSGTRSLAVVDTQPTGQNMARARVGGHRKGADQKLFILSAFEIPKVVWREWDRLDGAFKVLDAGVKGKKDDGHGTKRKKAAASTTLEDEFFGVSEEEQEPSGKRKKVGALVPPQKAKKRVKKKTWIDDDDEDEDETKVKVKVEEPDTAITSSVNEMIVISDSESESNTPKATAAASTSTVSTSAPAPTVSTSAPAPTVSTLAPAPTVTTAAPVPSAGLNRLSTAALGRQTFMRPSVSQNLRVPFADPFARR